jgi:predicted nucleotidyltransferase
MTETVVSEQNEDAPSVPLGEKTLDRLLAKLQRVFPRIVEHQPVRLAYLYGSVTTGRTAPFSDVDVALLVDEDLSPSERLKLILRVQLDLADQADIPDADVRIINDAPLVFRGRVVTDGLLVYARDEGERVEFETTTRMRYFDYQPVHKGLQDAFFADLRERGLYGRSGQD